MLKVEDLKNIVITGGAQGIGRCMARTFLSAGHKVYILDIDEAELVYAATSHLAKHYHDGQLGFAICDLRDQTNIRSTISKAADFLGGRIDVLINNGSIANPHWKDGKTMEDLATYDEWQAYIETNLTSPFVVSQASIPYMKSKLSDMKRGACDTLDPGPCIIHIGSFRAQQSDPNQEGYAASKAGQLGLMHSMAVSLSPFGIRVNLIAPGRIKAGHESSKGDQHKTSSDQHTPKDVEDHPANRAGTPEDIAGAAMYLIGAGFVTGQDITVDGGAVIVK